MKVVLFESCLQVQPVLLPVVEEHWQGVTVGSAELLPAEFGSVRWVRIASRLPVQTVGLLVDSGASRDWPDERQQELLPAAETVSVVPPNAVEMLHPAVVEVARPLARQVVVELHRVELVHLVVVPALGSFLSASLCEPTGFRVLLRSRSFACSFLFVRL